MQALSIAQKIGQLFFIGIPGTEVDGATRDLFDRVSPGGVCLFARNIRQAEQTRRLLNEISQAAPVPPILSVDQEGGLVDRLRRVAAPMPSASAVSTRGGIAETRELARITAEIVRILGFNMNFAPTVDVVDERRAKFSNGLHSRAFGASAEDVVCFARAYLEELQTGGCLGALKHFPGLGATEIDSHDALPTVALDAEALAACDLKPYRELIAAGAAQAVMIGHAAYPRAAWQEVDADGRALPASLNHGVVTGLLRQQLGFDGLVVTDDLEMGAITGHYGIGEACRRALLAGNDMLLICASPHAIETGYAAVAEAVKTGAIPAARIDASVARIAKFKSLLQPPLEYVPARLAELTDQITRLNAKLN